MAPKPVEVEVAVAVASMALLACWWMLMTMELNMYA